MSKGVRIEREERCAGEMNSFITAAVSRAELVLVRYTNSREVHFEIIKFDKDNFDMAFRFLFPR